MKIKCDRNTVIKICTIIMVAGLLAMFLILRYWYADGDGISAKELTLAGITDGMGLASGESYSSVVITLPSSLKAEDVLSVSSNKDAAYLEIDRDSASDNRLLNARIVALSPGIAELYVKSADSTAISQKYTVNVIAGDNAKLLEHTEVVTDPVLADGEVFVTPSGEKYHLAYTCAGKTSFAITLEEAIEKNYTPCKNCAIAK